MKVSLGSIKSVLKKWENKLKKVTHNANVNSKFTVNSSCGRKSKQPDSAHTAQRLESNLSSQFLLGFYLTNWVDLASLGPFFPERDTNYDHSGRISVGGRRVRSWERRRQSSSLCFVFLELYFLCPIQGPRSSASTSNEYRKTIHKYWPLSARLEKQYPIACMHVPPLGRGRGWKTTERRSARGEGSEREKHNAGK